MHLPDWFEALNTDFRYQLTVIGQFAQAILSSEIANHQFQIRSSVPNVKVSWQVTAVRQDPYVKAHPLVVEEAKQGRDRGHYVHPEVYGAPEEMSVTWSRYSSLMKRPNPPVRRTAIKPIGQAKGDQAPKTAEQAKP